MDPTVSTHLPSTITGDCSAGTLEGLGREMNGYTSTLTFVPLNARQNFWKTEPDLYHFPNSMNAIPPSTF
ncbi:unnamed protein product [Peniophora sp. CBMAI 1063]|nr:unnamed protein product [Peniophora sp. CBMAI 1063]